MSISKRLKLAARPAITRLLGSPEDDGLRRALERARRQLEKKDRRLKKMSSALEHARSKHSSVRNTPIFFVVGRAKSGTRWLKKLLDSHPDILCKGEGRFFGREWRQDYAKQVELLLPPTSLQNALLSAKDLKYWIDKSVWTQDEGEHLSALTRLTVEYFLTQSLSKTDKKIVGDKTPLVRPDIAKEIATICPEAKVIHIIRDGRDSAVSFMHHLWRRTKDQGGMHDLDPAEIAKRESYREDPARFLASGESIFTEQRIETFAREWRDRVSGTITYGSELIKENYTEVRYESLLEKPEEEVERLFGFLGADADRDLVRRSVEAASFEGLAKGRKRGEEDSTSGFRKGIAGDWHNVFSERDKAIFKEHAGGLLIELGYETNENW